MIQIYGETNIAALNYSLSLTQSVLGPSITTLFNQLVFHGPAMEPKPI